MVLIHYSYLHIHNLNTSTSNQANGGTKGSLFGFPIVNGDIKIYQIRKLTSALTQFMKKMVRYSRPYLKSIYVPHSNNISAR